ncbi:hypothetical protein ETH_00033035 [Eimeria tenella]|uniref:ABC1 atypical kinase-like domain-containing protein n=1 Tax=Eimeria tenella TaxID=5802 RepID=U6L589_EIMTE|nr:hypothetical protein ETH_00033035 [Eimeria tenella]CDJ45557.1 hypothetical protein ETH_00033035 [Eimeria tenella]|eukprot:XP_013236303.1 hypothetical protein ETH_00033035 [Eimeria tenella]
MPPGEAEKMLRRELGRDWRQHFLEFDMNPFAAASIGQVHRAVLKTGEEVAVKIQFPGIAASITSDVKNLLLLLQLSLLLPSSFFLDRLSQQLQQELLSECNYLNEANFHLLFSFLLQRDFPRHLRLPQLYRHLTTQRVITTQFVRAVPFAVAAQTASQEDRNKMGELLLRLVLREIFIYRLINTDANPANFMWDGDARCLWLLDFGAGRSYSAEFVEDYWRLLQAAVIDDRQQLQQQARRLGFISAVDTPEFVEAQCCFFSILASPFKPTLFRDICKELEDRSAAAAAAAAAAPPAAAAAAAAPPAAAAAAAS